MTVTTIPELTLGDRLRLTREKARISRERMGQEFGVAAGAIGHWETDRSMPRDMISTIRAWSELTGFDAHWLAFGETASQQMSDWDLIDHQLPLELAAAS